MSMEYYRGMLIQRTRIDAFQRAIHDAVRPGDRVLEIGAGLGTFAFFAAQAGAAKVWAVEGGPIVSVSKTIARMNDLADRVEFIRGWYPGIALPRPVDVLIFEDYPARLIDSWTYGVLRQLHADVIRKDTRLVPARARMRLAPVYSDEAWQLIGGFAGERDTAYGIDWLATREYICNTPLPMPLRGEDLVHEPRTIAEFDLRVMPQVPALGGAAEWRFDEPTVVHGLAYWFDLDVGGGVWLSNAPGGDPRSWGHLFLPVAEQLSVPAGETLAARVAPEATGDGSPGWLVWEVQCGRTAFRGHEFKADPAALADVVRNSPSWVPDLTPQAEREARVLNLADGTRSVDEIARALRGTNDAGDLAETHNFVLATLAGRAKVSNRAATR